MAKRLLQTLVSGLWFSDDRSVNMKIRSKWALTSVALAAVALFSGGPMSATAAGASQKEARVTEVIREVKLLPEDAKARPAALNDKVSEDTAVRTGNASRSELTFVDLTITRLGANTIFSFNRAGRNAQLNGGAMLLRVPKDSNGAQIRTDACSVAITGTTVILEATRAGRNKLIVLEGGARMSLNKYPKESAYAHGGQMLDVPAGAMKMPAPVDIDIDQVMKTHSLITDFRPLPSQDLIYASRNRPGFKGLGPVLVRTPLGPIAIGGSGGGGSNTGSNNPPGSNNPSGAGKPVGVSNPGQNAGGQRPGGPTSSDTDGTGTNAGQGSGGGNISSGGGSNVGGTGKGGGNTSGRNPTLPGGGYKAIGPSSGSRPQASPTPRRRKLPKQSGPG